MLVFALSRITGDPRNVLLPVDARPEDYELAGRVLGLDQPVVLQYLIYLRSAAQGDFGTSFRARRPVTEVIASRVGPTLQLATVGMGLAIVVGIPLGIIAAVRRGRTDLIIRSFVFLGQATPSFLVGLVLINVFAVQLRILPAGGSGELRHLVLPSLTLAAFVIAGIARLMRSGMLEILNLQYIQVARGKGLRERHVVLRHALRPALIPVATYAGMLFGTVFLTGSIVTEIIFSWPGMGQLVYQSVLFRDFPVVQGLVLLFATIFIGINLFVDMLYAYLDPRISLGA